ncbi:MAG: energy transducer TonB [Campylobacterales bacterium]|nr:energy transducer TonB [Campylobacterales bacterium]
MQTPKQPPKRQEQLSKPPVETPPIPFTAAFEAAPLRVSEAAVQPIVQQSVSKPVKTAVAPKEPAPANAAAEPARPDPKVKEAYLHYLRQTIDERKVYPKNAKRLRQTGTVMVKFTLMAEGTITNVSVADSSGFELLDQAAADLLRNISRVRPLPQELGREPIILSIPIQYTLG